MTSTCYTKCIFVVFLSLWYHSSTSIEHNASYGFIWSETNETYAVGTDRRRFLTAATDVYRKGKYIANRHRQSFKDAKAWCRLQHGASGKMVSIKNAEENKEVLEICAAVGNGCWIGLEAPPNPSGWADVKKWVDGNPYDKKEAKWGPGEPNNWANNEKCAEMISNGRWNDLRCDDTRKAICSVPPKIEKEVQQQVASILKKNGIDSKITIPTTASNSKRIPLYRYWNDQSKDHLYTTKKDEIGTTTTGKTGKFGYKFEGLSGALEPSTAGIYKDKITKVDLYRYWNDASKDHFYTTNKDEIGVTKVGSIGKNGYKSEGSMGRCFQIPTGSTIPSGMTALYRYWNPTIKDHFYTIKKDEIGTITAGQTGKYGFKSEGIVCYIWSELYPSTTATSSTSSTAATSTGTSTSAKSPSSSSSTAIQHIPLYRYWSDTAKDHLYTTTKAEIGTTTSGQIGKFGYKSEGRSGALEKSPAGPYTATIKKVDLYRYWNSANKDHFYTTNPNEIGVTTPGQIGKNGYKSEGSMGRCFQITTGSTIPPGMIALYRYWNPTIKDHLYSIKKDEIGVITAGKTGKYGFRSEGIVCYIWKDLISPSSSPSSTSSTAAITAKIASKSTVIAPGKVLNKPLPPLKPPIKMTPIGTWKLLLHLKDIKKGMFDTSILSKGIVNPTNPKANTYSIIGAVNKEDFKDTARDNKYSFKIVYTYEDGPKDSVIWKQSSWITESKIQGYKRIEVAPQKPNPCTKFKGLCRAKGSYASSTYLTGNDDGKCWWNSIGTIGRFKGQIPAFGSKIAIAEELYIYIPPGSVAHVKTFGDPGQAPQGGGSSTLDSKVESKVKAMLQNAGIDTKALSTMTSNTNNNAETKKAERKKEKEKELKAMEQKKEDDARKKEMEIGEKLKEKEKERASNLANIAKPGEGTVEQNDLDQGGGGGGGGAGSGKGSVSGSGNGNGKGSGNEKGSGGGVNTKSGGNGSGGSAGSGSTSKVNGKQSTSSSTSSQKTKSTSSTSTSASITKKLDKSDLKALVKKALGLTEDKKEDEKKRMKKVKEKANALLKKEMKKKEETQKKEKIKMRNTEREIMRAKAKLERAQMKEKTMEQRVKQKALKSESRSISRQTKPAKKVLQEVKKSIGKDTLKGKLLKEIRDLNKRERELDLKHKMIEERNKQRMDLDEYTKMMTLRHSAWERQRQKERIRRRMWRHAMLQRQHQLRLLEHNQLINGLHGFVTKYKQIHSLPATKPRRRRSL